MVESVIQNPGGKLRPQPVVEVVARGDIEAEAWVDRDGGIRKGSAYAGKDGTGKILVTAKIVDEAEAEVSPDVGAKAGRWAGDDKLLFREFIGHRPAGPGGQVGEIAGFRNLAGAVAFRIIEVEGRGKLRGKLEIQAQTQGVLLVQATVKTVPESRGRSGIVLGQRGGLGIGVIGQAVRGKGCQADFFGKVEKIRPGQVVVGSGEIRGIRKNVGSPPVHRDGVPFREGVEVAGRVGEDEFIQEIGFPGIADQCALALSGAVQVEITVVIEGKSHAQFVGDLFDSPGEKVHEHKILNQAKIIDSRGVVGLAGLFLAEIVEKGGSNADFGKKPFIARHGAESGGPSCFQ